MTKHSDVGKHYAVVIVVKRRHSQLEPAVFFVEFPRIHPAFVGLIFKIYFAEFMALAVVHERGFASFFGRADAPGDFKAEQLAVDIRRAVTPEQFL